MAPVFGTLAIACVGVCLRRLARRARRPWLSRLVTTMIGLVLAGGVLNAVTLFGMIFIMPAMPINGLVEVQTNMAGGIVMSACYVTGLVVLFKCRRLLTAALVNDNGWRTTANDSPLCKKCGCYLTGNTSGNCPECGAESADFVASEG